MLNVFWIRASKKIAYAYQGLNFGILNVLILMNVQMEHTSVVMHLVSIWKAHTVAQERLMLFGLLMEQDRIKEMSRLHNRILSSKESIFWHKIPKKQVRFQIVFPNSNNLFLSIISINSPHRMYRSSRCGTPVARI